MTLNLEIDNTTLDILTTKLKVVSQLDILKWLSNFPKSEHKFALNILQNLTVYTIDDIENILNDSFSDLIKEIPGTNQVIVIPLGKFGKSGSMISYFFQKTSTSKKNKRIHLKSSLDNIEDISKPYSLVIIDDFIGTGSSFVSFFNEKILVHKEKFSEIYFIGIAGMDFGVKEVKKYVSVRIPISNIFKKAFSSEASYFGYRNYSKHREFCYKYGSKLVAPKKSKSEKDNVLGYGNSQSLVSFSYGTPNNTLPIIWANKEDWIPLIPRFSIDRISNSKNLRKSILHELSILREFGSDQLKETFFSFSIKRGKRHFSSVNKIDFSIYSIIKLSRRKYTSVSICQILGILHKDYEAIISECITKKIMNIDGSLTLLGLNLYNDAKKCIESRKRYAEKESQDYYKIREVKYLPKIFNGKS
ncbi:phosphoribosyltransferase-like protein [Bergeyella cardium]|uniref:Uncharacterized protein n=1 Tax=Bergeyella cardium TaxID=1585976 RepID=A0A6P1QZ19_9FLAO|nr:hypothetical protein [Bergeyella cardium]QHN65950.1 hypothetical protein DBX24_08685 [Bergeyella cardium]WHE33555.1 hypothetical protein P8603_08745 [Bergeyella cardium]WHF60205.1 hypothetical protein O0R51_08740 [Bergeyella cardium]